MTNVGIGAAAHGAVVRALHGPSVAETAAQRLESAIIAGTYGPGQTIALREIAEQAGCRLPALLSHVRQLEHDGFVTIRHDTAMVRPLDADEWRDACKMMHLVYGGATERALDALTDSDIAQINATQLTASPYDEEFRSQMVVVNARRTNLIYANVIPRSVMRLLDNVKRRYYAPFARPRIDLSLNYQLVDVTYSYPERYQTRKVNAVTENLARIMAVSEEIGHQIVQVSRDSETVREHARIIQLRR